MDRPFPLFIAVLLLTGTASLFGQGLDLFDDEGDVEQLFLEEEAKADAENLATTHLTELADWPGVCSRRAAARGTEEEKALPWRVFSVKGYEDRRFVGKRRLDAAPLSNRMAVPEKGTYRLWLGYVGTTKRERPVELRLEGANSLQHRFGTRPVPDNSIEGGRREGDFYFESEMDRISAMSRPVMIWESRDVELQAGETTILVDTADKDARIDAVVVTKSTTLLPSKSPVEGEGTLNHTYYRWRFVDAPRGVDAVHLDSFIHYMWAHYRPGSSQRIWYSSMGDILSQDGTNQIPVGEWSDWNNCTEQVINGGRYFADRITVRKELRGRRIDDGTVEVQLAWRPDPHAALRTIRNPVAEGWTRYLVPVARDDGYRAAASEPEDETGVWGVRDADYVAQLQSEREAVRRLMDSIPDEALVDGVMPERIRMYTHCNTSEAAYDVAIPLLRKIGINWIPKIDFKYRKKYGLHLEDSMANQSGTVFVHSNDPLDPLYPEELYRRAYSPEARKEKIAADPDYLERPHWLKMGDEIGPVTSPTHINGLPDCRDAFLEYLRKAAGGDPQFFGVDDFRSLYYDYRRRPNQTLPQRRLYYHGRRFIWWFTAQFYKRHSDAARRGMPNVVTWCNYTPGGPMFAGDMDRSNWFALARYNATNGHAGEDWLSSGSGYTSQAGVQTESYYGALVECGARPNGQDLTFLMVGRSGELDRKMCTLVASNIFSIYVYDWGPEFTRGAVDTFSHVLRCYETLNRGARAIGPAEDILLDGRRVPRDVAILYNRTNEIWHGGGYGVFSDRLYRYLALRHAHRPADILLEEDMVGGVLENYRVLYVDGLNLRRDALDPLRDWVERGGTLVAAGGTAMRDEYDEPIQESVEFLGAEQHAAGASDGRWMPFYISDHEPIDTITVKETQVTPALEAGVVGLKTVLSPTTGTPVASYDDGAVAAVHRRLGKGHVLLYGVSPGLLYANNAPRDDDGKPTNYATDRRLLTTKAAKAVLPAPKAEHTEPLLDLTCFETEKRLAVVVVDYSYAPGTEGTLTVRTDKPVESVRGTLSGPLTWKRRDGEIRIDYPVPESVDIVVLE